jgi:hypothetical protein
MSLLERPVQAYSLFFHFDWEKSHQLEKVDFFPLHPI